MKIYLIFKIDLLKKKHVKQKIVCFISLIYLNIRNLFHLICITLSGSSCIQAPQIAWKDTVEIPVPFWDMERTYTNFYINHKNIPLNKIQVLKNSTPSLA